jgi:hypothetical protein
MVEARVVESGKYAGQRFPVIEKPPENQVDARCCFVNAVVYT